MMISDARPGLYPPAVVPVAKPLPVHRFLFQYIQNPLRMVPEAAYTEDMVVRHLKGSARKVVWCVAPAIVEQVLQAAMGDFHKTQLEKRVLGGPAGNGVLTADDAEWRWQRRTIAPLFRPADLQLYVPSMVQAAEEQVTRWAARPGAVSSMDRDMTETTFAVITRTMLGGESHETDVVKEATERYLSRVSWEMAHTLMGLPLWLPHPGSWRMAAASRQLRRSIQTLIDRRKNEPGGDRLDLLARLLAARDPETGDAMAETQVIDNMLTLLGAGHETTAKALTWTLYLLARAPEWQDRLRTEVNRVTGSSSVDALHLPELALTQQVLKEAMRLYPPAPSMARVFNRPAKINGIAFNPGDVGFIPIYAIHRHKKLWDDPGRFDPTRFTPDREKTRPRAQYMPFGAGPRVCVGNGFAMAEAIALLATFLKSMRFDWDGKQSPEPLLRITLRPRGGIALTVTPL